MAKITVESQDQLLPTLKKGALMIHNEPPAMVVIVDEVEADGIGFFGTDLETGTRISYAVSEFAPFIGKLTLEQ